MLHHFFGVNQTYFPFIYTKIWQHNYSKIVNYIIITSKGKFQVKYVHIYIACDSKVGLRPLGGASISCF